MKRKQKSRLQYGIMLIAIFSVVVLGLLVSNNNLNGESVAFEIQQLTLNNNDDFICVDCNQALIDAGCYDAGFDFSLGSDCLPSFTDNTIYLIGAVLFLLIVIAVSFGRKQSAPTGFYRR